MSGKRNQVAAIGLALALSACTTHQIHYSNPTAAAGGAAHKERQSFFLWGLVGGAPVDLTRVCPNGVAAIDSMASFGDQLFALATAGIYSPMSVNVQCAGGPVAQGGAR